MKLNFRKIASVIASAVMIGSTAGIALAANYPAPFVSGGTADAAVVITSGTHAGAISDWDAAVSVQTALQGLVTSTSSSTSAVTVTGGDSVKIEKSTNKLNLNDALTDIWTTRKIGKDELKTLLADKTYRSKDNIDYSYEQYLTIAASTWAHFADSDYKDKAPSLGIRVASNTPILNYTIDFAKDPRSDVDSSGKLEDLQDRDITIFGKTYKLLNAWNKSSDTKLELMKGTITDTINLNEEKTEPVGDKTYKVTLTFIDSDEAQFKVVDSKGNDQSTTKLTKGGTYKLVDGTQLGVTDISYQAFATGVMSAEFTIGADKLTLENGQVLEINDVDNNDINVYITRYEAAANKVDIQKIVLEWKPSEESYVTADKELTMPGFNNIKISAGNMTFPSEETVKIDSVSSYGIEMTVPIKDGNAKFAILYGNDTDFGYLADTNDGTGNIKTSNNNALTITFDKDTDKYFIATWNDTTSAESYLLKITSTRDDSSDKRNYTKVENAVSGVSYGEKKDGDEYTIGNVLLTVNRIDHLNKEINLTIGAGGTFNRIYTKGGMEIFLPFNGTTTGATAGDARATAGFLNSKDLNQFHNLSKFTFWMAEEDKDGNLGLGSQLNITVGHSSSKAEVSKVDITTAAGTGTSDWSNSGRAQRIPGTDDYEGYAASDLATKLLHHQPSGSPDWVEVVYHGAQSYANVFITDVSATVSGSAAVASSAGGNIVVVKDTEIDSVKDKNLVVIGGSCINSVARKIVDPSATAPVCGADFTAKTNVDAGKRIVKAIASPYNSAKTAVLVAGYEAAETKLAAEDLKAGAKTDVGTVIVNPAVTTT